MRLLLLEDNPTDALLVEAALEEIPGALPEITHVETLAAAQKALREQEFDVALVDLSVPDGHGLGNFEKVQGWAPRTPVIVLTGLSNEDVAFDAIQRGAADYLRKDATDAHLLERSIRYAIERKKNETTRLELERAHIRRAEAEAANRAKDEFLATLSHELRTPLNAIMGWTSLLRTNQLDKETVDQALVVIERNAKTQAQLIEDLLDVSRIVAGNFRLETVDLDMSSVVKTAAEAVTPSAAAKGVILDLQMDNPSRVCGDPMRLQQVTWNLISNAIKFSPEEGTVTIKTFTSQNLGDEWAVLEVRDQGAGISPEFLPYVFDRFRQADGSTTRRHGGLGLGLAIVKNVVELHGGRVSVSSDGVGQGTTFRAELPLSKGDCVPQDESTEPNALDWSRLKILCVDDQLEAREWLRLTLSRRGAQVQIAANVVDALERMTSWRPHIALCDIGMPDNDGYDLLQAIHEQQLPIAAIAITGFAFPGERDRAREAGFQEFLAKPVDAERLFRVVEAVATERLSK
ncbi:autoinducer 2 sensor kinase/phosphatase LuxQ [Abditibacteriota bacterium]|nr:autoinducer 2 sensor kinase/phosphatase LuxQ [Abditibacteriota bacterium]